MLLRHRNRHRYWYDFTAPNGEYQIGICFSRTDARRYARLLRGHYRGRWYNFANHFKADR